MSALGQKRTWRDQIAMSALPPIADIPRRNLNVRFGPQADSCTAANSDHRPQCADRPQRTTTRVMPGILRCPLYPRKRTFVSAFWMSALGQEATYAVQQIAAYSITSSGSFGKVSLNRSGTCGIAAREIHLL